jgi:hypothetical protein
VCQRTRPDLLQYTWRRSVDRQQAIHRHPQVTCMRQGYSRSLEKGAQVDVMTCTHIRALPSGMPLFTMTLDLRRDNLQNVWRSDHVKHVRVQGVTLRQIRTT